MEYFGANKIVVTTKTSVGDFTALFPDITALWMLGTAEGQCEVTVASYRERLVKKKSKQQQQRWQNQSKMWKLTAIWANFCPRPVCVCLEEEYFAVSDIGRTELGQQHERIYDEVFLLAISQMEGVLDEPLESNVAWVL